MLVPAAIAVSHLLYRKKLNLDLVFILTAAALSLGTLFAPDNFINQLVVRRGLFSGVVNIEMYYEYFKVFPHWVWGFSENALPSEAVGELVAWHFGEENNNNGGIIASGIKHAGAAGVILYSVGLSAIFQFVTNQSVGLSKDGVWLVAVLILGVLHTLINVDLTTALWTHGLGLLIVISALTTRYAR